MTDNVKFILNVDDTTHAIYNWYWARKTIRISDTKYNVSCTYAAVHDWADKIQDSVNLKRPTWNAQLAIPAFNERKGDV